MKNNIINFKNNNVNQVIKYNNKQIKKKINIALN